MDLRAERPKEILISNPERESQCLRAYLTLIRPERHKLRMVLADRHLLLTRGAETEHCSSIGFRSTPFLLVLGQ